jgi:hypothetical protein
MENITLLLSLTAKHVEIPKGSCWKLISLQLLRLNNFKSDGVL